MMPWTADDPRLKNLSDPDKRKWAAIANAQLAITGDDVGAIKTAWAAVAKGGPGSGRYPKGSGEPPKGERSESFRQASEALNSAPDGQSKSWIAANQSAYQNNPEFRSVADMIMLHTQGEYSTTYEMTRKVATGKFSDTPLVNPDWLAKHEGSNIESGVGMYDYTNFFTGESGSDNPISNPTSWAEGAANLNAVISESEPLGSELYRGMYGQKAFDEFSSLGQGDEIDIPGVTSFTSDRVVMDRFASGGGARKLSESQASTRQVNFIVEPGAKGIKVGALSPYRQKEVLSKGKFRVTSVHLSPEPDPARLARGRSGWPPSEIVTVIVKVKQVG